jgi:acyl-CoA thioesterase II
MPLTCNALAIYERVCRLIYAQSLHCYFLLGANPSIPTIYYVDRLRTGRSYATRSVRAVQQGKAIFIMMCSFHKPEPRQPTHSWPMPRGIPPPEECELEEVRWAREAQNLKDERLKKFHLDFAAERTASPIAVSCAKEGWVMKDGTKCYMYWMQARNVNVQNYEAPFQKVCPFYGYDSVFLIHRPRTTILPVHIGISIRPLLVCLQSWNPLIAFL